MRGLSKNQAAAQLRSASYGIVAVDDFKPFRDRYVRSSQVDCPDCGAKPGDMCIRAGRPSSNAHPSRRRMALRAGLVRPQRSSPGPSAKIPDVTQLPPEVIAEVLAEVDARTLERCQSLHVRPPVTGACHACGADVSGERRYCGPCAAERMSSR